MQVDNQTIRGMLNGISDPGLRATYEAILNGEFPYIVHCVNPQKNPETGKPFHKSGVVVGYIDGKGRVIDEPKSNKSGRPISGIESSRDRLDGRKGFKCYCGNWSIEAPEETGIINRGPLPGPPTKNDILKIQEKLVKSKKSLGMNFVNGELEYDGFLIKEGKK